MLKREVREERRALSTEGGDGGGKRRWCWKKREERLLVTLRKVIALEREKRKERRERKSERERRRKRGREKEKKRERGRERKKEIQDGGGSRAATEGSDEVRSRDERVEPFARSIERSYHLCYATAVPMLVVNGSSGTTPCRALAMASESEYTTIATFTIIIIPCYDRNESVAISRYDCRKICSNVYRLTSYEICTRIGKIKEQIEIYR